MEPAQAPPEQPIVNIVGEKVALGPRRKDLLPLYLKWINDFEVTRTLDDVATRPMTMEAEEAWYERASKSENELGFTIYERATMRPIGNCSLHDVNLRDRTAEFGIMIGEKDCWNKGYGTEAATLILDYGFTLLGLHNIMLRAFSYNPRAIRAYTRAGFREIGCRREAHRLGTQVSDVAYMDCLSSEFRSPVLCRLLDKGKDSSTVS